jgi:hypothetical protein
MSQDKQAPPASIELEIIQALSQPVLNEPVNVVNQQSQPVQLAIPQRIKSRKLSYIGCCKEYQGFYIPKGLAITILLLNIFLPRIGTIVLGCYIGDPGWVCGGLMQTFTVVIFGLGWFCAIQTGVQAVCMERKVECI